MKKIVFLFVFALTFFRSNAQQDPQYSMYMFNPLAINPAYAGTKEALSVTFLVRQQWVGIADGAPATNSLSVQGPLRKKKIGLGLELISDRLGPKDVGGALVSYSYNLAFLKGKLSFGLRTGIYNYTIDWSRVTYKDNTDPFATKTLEKKSVFTGDFGVYYYTKSFYWGISTTHLNRDTYSNFGPDPQYQAHHLFSPIGLGIPLSDNLVFNPSILVKMVKGSPVGIDANLNFLIRSKLWLGLSVRKGYGISALALWNITDKLQIGFAYDKGLNRIGTLGKGSFEIMIKYNFNVSKTTTITPRYL